MFKFWLTIDYKFNSINLAFAIYIEFNPEQHHLIMLLPDNRYTDNSPRNAHPSDLRCWRENLRNSHNHHSHPSLITDNRYTDNFSERLHPSDLWYWRENLRNSHNHPSRPPLITDTRYTDNSLRHVHPSDLWCWRENLGSLNYKPCTFSPDYWYPIYW